MTRKADHDIAPLFLRRSSPRAMSGAPLPRAEFLRLFEAARWSPSSGNGQPWRFVLAERDTPAFAALFATLGAFNQEWCGRAAGLVLVCAESTRTTTDGARVPRRLAAFDAGAAWMALALQGSLQGLVIHAMEGFDHAAAHAAVGAPADVDALVLVAVGLPGDPALLSEKHRAGEAPNAREPLTSRLFFGRFG